MTEDGSACYKHGIDTAYNAIYATLPRKIDKSNVARATDIVYKFLRDTSKEHLKHDIPKSLLESLSKLIYILEEDKSGVNMKDMEIPIDHLHPNHAEASLRAILHLSLTPPPHISSLLPIINNSSAYSSSAIKVFLDNSTHYVEDSTNKPPSLINIAQNLWNTLWILWPDRIEFPESIQCIAQAIFGVLSHTNKDDVHNFKLAIHQESSTVMKDFLDYPYTRLEGSGNVDHIDNDLEFQCTLSCSLLLFYLHPEFGVPGLKQLLKSEEIFGKLVCIAGSSQLPKLHQQYYSFIDLCDKADLKSYIVKKLSSHLASRNKDQGEELRHQEDILLRLTLKNSEQSCHIPSCKQNAESSARSDQQQELNSLYKEIAHLQSQLRASTERCSSQELLLKNATQVSEFLKVQKNELECQFESLCATNELAVSKLEELTTSRYHIQCALDDALNLKKSLQRENKSIYRELNALREISDEQTSSYETLRSSESDLRLEFAGCCMRLSKLLEVYEDTSLRLESVELELDNTKCQNAITQTKSIQQLDEQRSLIESISEELKTKGSAVQTLNTELSLLKDALDNCNANSCQLQHQVMEWQSKYAELESELSAKTDELATSVSMLKKYKEIAELMKHIK